MAEDRKWDVDQIEFLVLDIDGTMTDGGIYYDDTGNEYKKFNTRDAAGFFAAHQAGIKLIVLTGRECNATVRRMQELKVDYLFQNIKDKALFLQGFMEKKQITGCELGYIGDDLNDLAAMKLAGFVGCPADSCAEVIHLADYVSTAKGGSGAVRDIIEHLLCQRGEWQDAIAKIYGV